MSDVLGSVHFDRPSGTLHGWVYDRSDLTRAHAVHIVLDGRLAAVVAADLLIYGDDRPQDAIYNGFQYVFPSPVLTNDRLHIVSVRSSDGAELSGSPFVIETVSSNEGLLPQFRIVDRPHVVSAEPRPAGAGGDWIQIAAPERPVRPQGSMVSREHAVGGVWGHQAYQPYQQYIAYMADVYVDPLHGNVFDRAGNLWSQCQYLRNTDVIAAARERIASAPASIPTVDADVLIYSESVMGNYAHWHSDCLPSILLARSMLTAPYTVLSPPVNKWQGLSAQMILDEPVTPTEGIVKVRGAYCTGYIDGRSIYPDSGVMATYDHLRVAAGLPAPTLAMADERVFISRKDAAGVRLLENEDELVAALEPYGFKSRLLAQLPYTEQIRLFTRTNMIVANHGAGLTNLAFCPPGAKAFEIIRSGGLVGTLRYLAVRAGLSHHWYSVDDAEAVRLDVPRFMEFFKQQMRP